MQFQSLFDSVCRCFGHGPANNGSGASGIAETASGSSAVSQPVQATPSSSTSSVRRRTNRLELKDKQWDELFEKEKKQQQLSPSNNHHNSKTKTTDDLGTAHAVASAKLAANPPRHRTKRKRSGKAREEIFRSKEEAAAGRHAATQSASATPHQNSFSRLLHPTLAMCFATPVRGTEEEGMDEMDVRSVDNSDTATLNTCEDTITSTVYFENKISHMTETRPPMPLFHQFKLGHEKDEIRNIIATDSHSSLNMIRLLKQQPSPSSTAASSMATSPHQQQHQQRQHQPRHAPSQRHPQRVVELEESSSESADGRAPKNSKRACPTSQTGAASNHNVAPLPADPSGGSSRSGSGRRRPVVAATDLDAEMEDALPDVKAVSSSTDSSRQSQHHPHHQVPL